MSVVIACIFHAPPEYVTLLSATQHTALHKINLRVEIFVIEMKKIIITSYVDCGRLREILLRQTNSMQCNVMYSLNMCIAMTNKLIKKSIANHSPILNYFYR
jgi:hypothetical protein